MTGKQLATDMLVAAARRFVARCERGEVRSVRTYAELRDALAFYDVAEELPTIVAQLGAPLTDEDIREIERQLGLPMGRNDVVSWAPDLVALSGVRFHGFPLGRYHLDVYHDRRSSELVVRFRPDGPGFSDSDASRRAELRAQSEKRRRHTRRK